VTQIDQVAAAHAALDNVIANAKARLEEAQKAKDRLTAAQAEVASAVAASATPSQAPAQ